MRDVLPGGSSFGAGQSMVVGTCVEKWKIEGWASNLNHSQNELANGFEVEVALPQSLRSLCM